MADDGLRSALVLGDSERSSAYASEQRRLVRAAVDAEVLAFTPFWRDVATEAGLSRVKDPADLRTIAPRSLSALGPPDTLVLRPSSEAVRKDGPRPLRRQLRRTRLRSGRVAAARAVLDPLYKPIHWIIENETPVGCTEADLVRLAEIGRRTLDLAGVTQSDAIVGLVPLGPSLSTWQLALGAREARIPLAGLSPSTSLEAVAMLGPTVLAGRPVDLRRVLLGLDEAVRTAIVTVLAVTRGPLPGDERAALSRAAGPQASVVEVWAPPGVRALWTQCRGGEGVHTWPQAELLEVCGPDGAPVAPGEVGQLVWTGLGWRGTVLVRLATGVTGRLVEGACSTCGRTTPRVVDARLMPGAALPDEIRPLRDDDLEPVVGPVKPTGGVESVRTVRPPRRARSAVRAAGDVASARDGAPRPAPADDEAPAVRAVAPTAADGAVRAVADRDAAGARAGGEPAAAPAVAREGLAGAAGAADKEELPGTVRAVAKEEVAVGAKAPTDERARSSIGAVDHLPPRPEVGPDAGSNGGADSADPWLPETGEVDAWPAPVLASTDGLAAWQVEHRRRRGSDELVVHLALAEGAELGEVLVSLERSIGATQYVVADEAAIAARVEAAGGRRVVDRRRRDGRGDDKGNGSSGGGGRNGNGVGQGRAGRRPSSAERRPARKG